MQKSIYTSPKTKVTIQSLIQHTVIVQYKSYERKLAADHMTIQSATSHMVRFPHFYLLSVFQASIKVINLIAIAIKFAANEDTGRSNPCYLFFSPFLSGKCLMCSSTSKTLSHKHWLRDHCLDITSVWECVNLYNNMEIIQF